MVKLFIETGDMRRATSYWWKKRYPLKRTNAGLREGIRDEKSLLNQKL